MKRLCLIAALCSSVFAVPGFAPAAPSNVAPNNVACKEYATLDKGARTSLAAWLDGYSASDIPVEAVRYAPGDVADMQEKLLKACGAEPDQTLGDIEFDYGGKDEPFAPTCAAFARLKDNQATNMVLWTLGYVDYNNDVENVNMNELNALTRNMVEQCTAAPDANLLELVIKARKIGQ